MKYRILAGWTFQRAIFLALGIMMVFQSALQHQWAGVLVGGYFALMGLFGFGCAAGCYGGSCAPAQQSKTEIRDIELKKTPEK